MNAQGDLVRALTLLHEKKFRQAEAACREILAREPRHAPTLHLLALVRRDSGDVAGGEQLMRQSIGLDPLNADFHSNLGQLLRGADRLPEAERSYRSALALDPRHVAARYGLVRTLSDARQHGAAEAECRTLLGQQGTDAKAWTTLAMILRDQNRLSEAEAAYQQAVANDPNYAIAHHNLGSLFVTMERAEEALAEFERARSLGVKGFELTSNMARALSQLYRTEEAERAFAEAVAMNPRHVDSQLNLARLRFMRADPQFSRDIAQAAARFPDDAPLQLLLGNVLWRAGDLQGAERHYRDLLARRGPDPDLRTALAQVLHEAGRLQEAEVEATEAAIARPQEPTVVDTLVSILLARGRPEEAMPFIQVQRSRTPHDQRWIAHEATAARLLDQPLYRELYDYSRMLRTYDLETPPGWTSMEELNAALLRAFNARHVFVSHPLDQSLRNGSQTARNLVTDPDPAIRAVMQAFAEPIEDYRRSIGTEAGHPLTLRNHGPMRFAGAWSVQLRREGFHVNHVHPQGWISSAYYVSVPEEVHDVNTMSGWIKFGETRYPVPGAQAETFIKPRAGRLVLFPSYMWHGTNPIHGPEARTTIAFDAVPR
ncbi:MAG TPA: tetratricopeptide repeat protein [Steroidobacteraceae bacterium]|nr:tetratricopeptide repeat protein [Steroidobacteraceae bacterium]